MSNQRNYTDNALETFAEDMSNGEIELLVAGGVIPAHLAELEPNLRGSDVSRLIELAKGEHKKRKVLA
jgi:hypothetical protein